jgi:phospholipid-binding lipoprotein MlaA
MKHPVSAALTLLISLALPAQAGHKKVNKAAPDLANKSRPPTIQKPDPERPATSDPLEKLNRTTFAANDLLYKGVMHPIAKGTEAALPNPVLRSIHNFGQNLETPVRLINRLFRAQPMEAGKELTKLIINSTVGVGGLFKPSESFPALRGIKPADTGQTLGKAGLPPGPFLILPVLGPSNFRDLLGKAGDWSMNPLVYMGGSNIPSSVSTPVRVTRGLDENRQRMNVYRSTVEMTLDPYIAVREAYTDYRIAMIDNR